MQKQNYRKEQNRDDVKDEVDFTFNNHDEIDIHSTRNRRQRDVKSKSQHIANIFLFFFDLVSKNRECFKKHHAFKNK